MATSALPPGKSYVDWDLPTASRPLEEVRATRDAIVRRVTDLVAERCPDRKLVSTPRAATRRDRTA